MDTHMQVQDSILNVEPAVNRQPGFRRELVEQSTHLINSVIIFFSVSCATLKLMNQLFFIDIFQNFEKHLIFF